MVDAFRVLVIEDNPGDAGLIREMLRESGPESWQLDWAGGFHDGVTRLSNGAFDALLLDLSLPDSHGVEAVARVHADHPSLPIVVLTGNDDERIGLLAVEEGAQDYLVKGQVDASLLSRSLRYAMERKRDSEALRDSERLLRSLLQGLAHEVRNPLFAISATVDAFEVRLDPRHECGEFLGTVRAQVDRLGRLMQGVFQLGAGAPDERDEGPFSAVVAAAIQACGELAARSQVTIANEVGHGSAPLLRGQRRLSLALENVLRNALEHSPAGGTVRVCAERLADETCEWVECSINDMGPGFRPEDLREAFVPFFTRRRGAMGLGLSVARRIIDEHGGRIEARNRPGGGASILVRLPTVPLRLPSP